MTGLFLKAALHPGRMSRAIAQLNKPKRVTINVLLARLPFARKICRCVPYVLPHLVSNEKCLFPA
jgi:hypothetical protein